MKRNFNKENVDAGREYVEAYVIFIHYVETLYDTARKGVHGHFFRTSKSRRARPLVFQEAKMAAHPYQERLKRCCQLMKEVDLSVLLLTKPSNMFYLTGDGAVVRLCHDHSGWEGGHGCSSNRCRRC